jgi:hypothetical protein
VSIEIAKVKEFGYLSNLKVNLRIDVILFLGRKFKPTSDNPTSNN